MIPLPDLLATRRVGAVLAQVLQGGDVVAMLGDLGAGKTTLVDACVVALGGEGASSPTFALVQEIACAATTVWHADLYRLERADEVVELGLEELLGNPRGVSFVEWADKHQVLPRSCLRLTLHHVGQGSEGGQGSQGSDERALEIEGVGPRGRELAAAFQAALAAAEPAPSAC